MYNNNYIKKKNKYSEPGQGHNCTDTSSKTNMTIISVLVFIYTFICVFRLKMESKIA